MFVSAAEYERVNANKKDASDILKAIKKHKRKPTDESKRK